MRQRLAGLGADWFGTRNRVARWLVVWIIGFSSLVTLAISAIQLTFEYRNMRDDVDRQFEAAAVFLPNLNAAVWDFDETQIQLALNALVQQPYIGRAGVAVSEQSRRWSAGNRNLQNVVTRVYPLQHNSHGVIVDTGRLELAASLTQIYWKVAGEALTIIVGNAVKTFMVALFALAVFRRLITRRLEHLADKVGRLAPDAKAPSAAPDGSPRGVPGELDELQAVEWVLDDTTRRLNLARARLQDLNRRLLDEIAEKEALLQNALVGIALMRNERILSCNRRFEELFGFDRGAMSGRPVDRLFLNEKEWLDTLDAARGGAGADCFNATARMVRRDGVPFWAAISGSPVVSDQTAGEHVWVLSDVTAAKSMEAEMAKLRAELWRVLESQLVRHTVAAMAHEVNQPLGSIAALCEAAQRKLGARAGCEPQAGPPNARIEHIVERMAAESVRAGALLRKLMETLHTPEVAVEATALGPALNEAARSAPVNGFGDCEIIVECKAGLEPVLANRQQLEKVLLNLIGNAVEAMRAHGKADGRIWIMGDRADDGMHARVTVRDEGPGVSKQMETQIFHPFITTKAGNLGMGLAISRSLIEALGGRFWLEPGARPGATFRFTLPLAA